MGNVTKVILTTVGILLSFFFILALVGFIYLMMVGHALTKTFGYSEQELKNYSIFNNRRDIEVLEPAERTMLGLQVSDAKVKTLDREGIVYTINVNIFGHVSGDDFEEKKEGKVPLNLQYEDAKEFHSLEDLGFDKVKIGEKATDKDLYMALPYGTKLSDKESLERIYEALPYIRELNERMEKDTGYPLEEVYVSTALLDIKRNYDSPEDLGNQLAAGNIDSFKDTFYRNDKEEVKEIMFDLESYQFDVDPVNPDLTCYEMKGYDACGKYMLTLPTHVYVDGTVFRYDSEQDRENLLKAIEKVEQVDVPIRKLQLDPVEVPENPDEQNSPEIDGLIETAVEVEHLDAIHSTKDIRFEY